MLVLSRRQQERIILTTPAGEKIIVTVVELRHGRQGSNARIGIEAPKTIRVDREEVHESIQRGESRHSKEAPACSPS